MALITITEASEQVGVHPNTVRNWLKAGLIKGWRTAPRGMIYLKDKELLRLAEKMHHSCISELLIPDTPTNKEQSHEHHEEENE